MTRAAKKGAAQAAARLKKAQQGVEDAKAKLRVAFREAVVELFNEYGLCLEADGDLSAHLTIRTLDGRRFQIGDLPE